MFVFDTERCPNGSRMPYEFNRHSHFTQMQGAETFKILTFCLNNYFSQILIIMGVIIIKLKPLQSKS